MENIINLLDVNDTEILVVYTDKLADIRKKGKEVFVSQKYGIIEYNIEKF